MVQAVSYDESYQDSYQTVVPVDVYQDLVTELKETQALARNLEIQNRELWQQNQQLQQEMSKVVGAVKTFQQRVPTVGKEETSAELTVHAAAQRQKNVKTQPQKMQYAAIDDDLDEDIDGGEFSIWNVVITVICIIAVGVSVGYTAFRPAR
jgi:uncharacterized protein (DUF3084 family)